MVSNPFFTPIKLIVLIVIFDTTGALYSDNVLVQTQWELFEFQLSPLVQLIL